MRITAAAFFFLCACCTTAIADEMPITRADCDLLADIALVARAMVENNVEEGKRLPILRTIYAPDSPRAYKILEGMALAATQVNMPTQQWAQAIQAKCIASTRVF